MYHGEGKRQTRGYPIDLQAIYSVQSIYQLIFATLMVIICINTRTSVPAVFWWTVNIVLQTLGVMSLLLLESISPLLSFTICLLSVSIGSVSFALGLESFFKSRINHWLLYILASLYILVFTSCSLFAIPRSILLASISSSFILISIIYLIILHRAHEEHRFGRPRRVLMLLYVLFALLHGYRLILSLHLYRSDFPLPTGFEHPLLQLTSLISQLILIVVNFTVLILINSSLLGQLRQESSEKELLVRRLRQLASTDMLTGLLNRRSSEQQVKILLQSRVESKNRAGGLLLIDVDDFKTTNDTWGHDAGDTVLIHIASLLRRSIPTPALTGRWGGDEFIIFIPEITLEEFRTIAEGIERACSTFDSQCPYPCQVSIGGTLRKGDESYSELFERADRALYEAKKRGKGMVRWN